MLKMTQHGMSADSSAVRDSLRNEILCPFYRFNERYTASYIASHRRRVSATCAVGSHTPDKRGSQHQFLATVIKDVRCFPDAAQMAALNQRRASEPIVQLA